MAMWDYDKRTALHLVINLKRSSFDNEWGGRVGIDEGRRPYKNGRWINMVSAMIQQKQFFFQDFHSTPKYVFHHSTKDNAKFLYASPFLSFRSLLITPFDCIRRLPILIRFLHLQRAWLIMWTMSTFEAEKLLGLCRGAPWVCQVPCWDL